MAVTPIVVPGPRELAETAARLTAEIVGDAVTARGICYLALAGGQTPRACYELLARDPYRGSVPWRHVRVFWSDERRVPLDDPACNYGMARSALLEHVPVAAEHVFPLQEVSTYQRVLARLPQDAGGIPRFDLIHLGMGEDGHTASLFPGDPVLTERQALVAEIHTAKPPPDRLTFTLPLINAARAVVFLIQGAGKRAVLRSVLRGDRSLPAGMVRPADGDLRFIVDREAFSEG